VPGGERPHLVEGTGGAAGKRIDDEDGAQGENVLAAGCVGGTDKK
jgi:hypothetical protein